MSARAAEVYGYDGPDGHHIAVMAIEGQPESAHLACGPANHGMMTAPVRDEDVPEVAREVMRALYEAAGLPVPIVLDRVDEGSFSQWFSVELTALGRVLIDPKTPLTFAGTRELFAAVLAAVERAENEPDPAEVEALSRVILGEMYAGPTAAEGAARAILARYTLTERKP